MKTKFTVFALHNCSIFRPRGFGALASVLIFSALLTETLLAASARTFATRYRELMHEDRAAAEVLAYSCIFIALQSFIQDPGYAPRDAEVTVADQEMCTIESLAFSIGQLTVRTRAQARNAVVDLTAVAHVSSNGDISLASIAASTSTPP